MGTNYSYDPNDYGTSRDQGVKASRYENTTGDFYGFVFDVGDVFRGAGATGPRSWGVGILGDKTAGAVITAGADDALLRVSGNNYVANGAAGTAVFNFRGLNAAINNRNGGVVAELNHTFGSQNKVGGVARTIQGLNITAENYGTVADEFGGLKITLKNEAAVATSEYGIYLYNGNASIAGPVDALIKVAKGATNTGFTNLVSVDAAATLGITSATSVTCAVKIPISIAGVTYYIAAGTTTS